MADNFVGIVVGGRNRGKTTYTKGLMLASPLPKKLVVDIFDNPVWNSYGDPKVRPELMGETIHRIDVADIPRWRQGSCLVHSSDRDKLLEQVARDLRNCFCVLDDSRRFTGSGRVLKKSIADWIIDTKQKNVNLVLVYHTLFQVPRELLDLADFLVLFKTGARGDKGKLEYPEDKYRYPGFSEILQYVETSPNEHINVTIQIN